MSTPERQADPSAASDVDETTIASARRAADRGGLSDVHVDGWSLQENPRSEGGASDVCAECGACPGVIYHGRRLQAGHWEDEARARLCTGCFARRALSHTA